MYIHIYHPSQLFSFVLCCIELRSSMRTAVYVYMCVNIYMYTYGRGHPPGRGRWYAPSSRHLLALVSACRRCSFGVLFSLCACVCVVVGGVVLCRCVCVCDLLICMHVYMIHASPLPMFSMLGSPDIYMCPNIYLYIYA